MAETRSYVAFRFSIVPIDGHLFAEPVGDEAKLTWFRSILFRNQDYEADSGTLYALRGVEAEGAHATGKFSRRRITELHEKRSDDIKDLVVEDWPYLEFVCDSSRGRQILVIRFLTEIVQHPSTIAKVFAQIVNPAMWQHGHTVSFNPILSEETFWGVIEKAAGIFRLKFTLSSPNLFGANEAAHDALKGIQAIFNNSEVSFSLENAKGALQVPHDRVENLRDYADKGCGSWELSVKRGRGKKTIKSIDRAAKVTIEVDDSEDGREALRRALDRLSRFL